MKATCTWGEGPDVMVNLNGTMLILYEDPTDKDRWTHGSISEGAFDLTADEAEELANALLASAKAARDLNKSYNEYMREAEAMQKHLDNADKKKIEWKDIPQ